MTSSPAVGAGSGAAGPVGTLDLAPDAYDRLRQAIPAVADDAVTTIVREVPAYRAAFTGQLGQQITHAVQLALVNFLDLARRGGVQDPAEPIAPSTAAAYELGRGEARSGRSMDALLAAYRIGGRVSWRGLSQVAVAAGMSASTLGAFAELVFAYIDALSGASITGHNDELMTAGRVRERYRERLAELLVAEADESELAEAAQRAEWSPPRTLTAVLLPEGQVRAVLGLLDDRTLALTPEDASREEPLSVLLVPNTTGADRDRLLGLLEGRGATVGPERAWTRVAASLTRARHAHASLPRAERRVTLDTEQHLPELILGADPEAVADLRAIVLAPLAGQRPSSRARLEETLRSWLLHHGRRELVAADLYVHPQTVRYRMQQLRELYGDRLDNSEWLLRLTLALAVPAPARR